MRVNYYIILGVSQSANLNEIKSAYKKLAIQYHPDKNVGFEEKFKEINEAYSILSDVKKRADYDSTLTFSSTFKRWGHAFGESTVAKDFGKSYKKEPPKGDLLRQLINISLLDCINGNVIEYKIEYDAKCPLCDGTGAKTRKKCNICNGIASVKKIVNGEYVIIQCEHCHGTGYVINDVCLHCKGNSTIRNTQTINVIIPVGSKSGDIIKLNGLGNAGKYGGARGDLHLYIEQIEDDEFKRRGNDLYYKYEVTALDLILGKTFELVTPHGTVNITIPACTQLNSKIRVSGNGVGDGDLYIEFKLVIPTYISEEELELYTKLRNLEFSI